MFDITYCSQENCTNQCGRKLPDEVRQTIETFFPWRDLSYAIFCNSDGEVIQEGE
jgi:hypothetical protein